MGIGAQLVDQTTNKFKDIAIAYYQVMEEDVSQERNYNITTNNGIPYFL